MHTPHCSRPCTHWWSDPARPHTALRHTACTSPTPRCCSCRGRTATQWDWTTPQDTRTPHCSSQSSWPTTGPTSRQTCPRDTAPCRMPSPDPTCCRRCLAHTVCSCPPQPDCTCLAGTWTPWPTWTPQRTRTPRCSSQSSLRRRHLGRPHTDPLDTACTRPSRPDCTCPRDTGSESPTWTPPDTRTPLHSCPSTGPTSPLTCCRTGPLDTARCTLQSSCPTPPRTAPHCS